MKNCCTVPVTLFAILIASSSVYSQEGIEGVAQVETQGAEVGEREQEFPDGLAADDWASIRAAYEAGRHAARPTEAGFVTANPGQGWKTEFDGRGFLTTPKAGDWSWGLELVSYGFAGAEQELSESRSMDAEGIRVAVDWDGQLEEWYINDGRGLEHGYTLQERPQSGEESSRLRLHLALRGDLEPKVDTNGRGIAFQTEAGATALRYQGLVVFDVDGERFDACFEREGEGLLLSIDEANARYPLTIDPVAQQAYIKASNTESDSFGTSIALSGDTAIVGARNEDSSAKGVNGNQSDNSANSAGAAYIFVRSGSTWSQQAYLKAPNTKFATQFGDLFGTSVGISGDTAIVGAPHEDSKAAGVGGNPADNSKVRSGAAYIYVRTGSTWKRQAYLKASNTEAFDRFGTSLALSGDTGIVCAPGEGSSATGVDGDQTDDSFNSAGAAYVFEFDSAPSTNLGGGTSTSGSTPFLELVGTLEPGSQVGLELTNAVPGSFIVMVISTSSMPVGLVGGTYYPAPPFAVVLKGHADSSGAFSLEYSTWLNGLPSGTELWFQFHCADATSPFGGTLSNAVVGTTP